MELQDQFLEDGLLEVEVDIYKLLLNQQIYHKDLEEQGVAEMVEIYQNLIKFQHQELLIQVVEAVDLQQVDQV
jgi:hypothetical protein